MAGRPAWLGIAVLVAIVALAAILRLPGLDQRGRWDADQGHDMLVLRALVTRGEIPLLGPPTSIGTFHHGAVYYYLLAPAAWLSNADPVAVTGEIALIGIAAVVAAWWLARLVAGPVAGLAAGLLAAVSPAGIDESTFIWNPNLIPLASAIAFGAAIRAWQTRRPRWWLVAAAGAMVTSQLHVLGIVVVPPLALAWLADVRRTLRSDRGGDHGGPAAVRPLLGAGAGALAILAAGYVPLVVHELGHDFSETRAILDYVAGGGGTAQVGLAGRLAMVGLRSTAWPLAGLVTDRPAVALLATALALALGVVSVVARGGGRGHARWLAGALLWSVVALAVFAPSLAVVTPGLPNDHYHAFLDPLVLSLAGVGIARLASGWPLRAPFGRGAAAAALVALVAIAIVALPPATAEDGGWRLVDQAATRVIAGTGDAATVGLAGIPPFKSADALRFPLERRGLAPLEAVSGASPPAPGSAPPPPAVVVVCDPLFADVVGAACGGPAEDAWHVTAAPTLRLTDRFDAGPRRVISIYRAP